MPRPIIALLTDFGQRDHYVGAMKGVALGICPDATLVDITHDVPPQDVLGGALELAAAYRYFPPGTIFLVVVDPSVGSSRRGIAAESGDYRFIGPDNGVLSIALDETPLHCAVELTDPRYAMANGSRTFEGRDRFAPAAGWLASGIEVSAMGRAADALCRVKVPKVRVTTESVDGEVLRVDRFGNLITNIDRQTFERFLRGGRPSIRVRNHELTNTVLTYSDVSRGELCALFGSSDQLEIAIGGGSAAQKIDAERGTAVRVRPGA